MLLDDLKAPASGLRPAEPSAPAARAGQPMSAELRRDILGRVRNETQRIHRIVQELLDYSRAPREATEPVDLGRAIEQAVALVRAQTRFKTLGLTTTLPSRLPEVLGDTGRLSQVVLNLVVNAADATGGEGQVEVSVTVEAAQLVLAVSDDGPGIPPELRAKIFDPFFTTKEPGAGPGLGLSVSLALVEGLGGTIRLAEAARGTRFEVVLPVAPAR
jgi:signal transduction histidine kinase